MSEGKKARFAGFRQAGVEILVDSPEGRSLKDCCGDVGIQFDGTTFIVNGKRLSQAEAEQAKIKNGDEVRHARKGDGGAR